MSQTKNLDLYEQQIAEVGKRWRDLYRSGRRANRDRVREGLAQIYHATQLKAPRAVVWVDSPWELREAVMIVRRWSSRVHAKISAKAKDHRAVLLKGYGDVRVIQDLQRRITPSFQVNADQRVAESARVDIIHGHRREEIGTNIVVSVAAELLRGAISPRGSRAMEFDMAQEAYLRMGQVGLFFQMAALRCMTSECDDKAEWVIASVMDNCFHSVGAGISPQLIDFSTNVLGLEGLDYFDGLQILAEENVWWAPFQEMVIVCDPPVLNKYDDSGAVPAENGTVVQYSNGDRICAIDRVFVPERFIVDWDRVTAEDIISQGNAEVRRVLMQKYGYQRMIDELQAVLVHKDDYGELYKITRNNTPNLFVKVVNKTPEPDGSFKSYVLFIGNQRWGIHTAHDAVASTFGLSASEYQPAWES